MSSDGIRLLAFDLDGTLLDPEKRLSPGDAEALRQAAGLGVELVPATGRLLSAIPAEVLALPNIRHIIAINGAALYEYPSDLELHAALLAPGTALELMAYLDTLPVIYDCYMGGGAWMSRRHKALIDETVSDRHYRRMLHELRKPVDELKAFVAACGKGVQKIQLFTADNDLRERLICELPRRFGGIVATSSVSSNVEINSADATKGKALSRLARILGLPDSAVMAIGDGLNDFDMLTAAGISVAMGNAHEDIKRLASYVTAPNSGCGVAQAVRKFIIGKDV